MTSSSLPSQSPSAVDWLLRIVTQILITTSLEKIFSTESLTSRAIHCVNRHLLRSQIYFRSFLYHRSTRNLSQSSTSAMAFDPRQIVYVGEELSPEDEASSCYTERKIFDALKAFLMNDDQDCVCSRRPHSITCCLLQKSNHLIKTLVTVSTRCAGLSTT